MKTRLLNASHCALGYLGSLAGHTRIDELMTEQVFRDYVVRLMDDEVTPLIPEPDGIDLVEYKRTLLQRFANPAIADQLSRLCRRGSTKMPQHLLSSLHEALAQGRPHRLLTLAVAAWFRYLRGTDETGRPIAVEDAQAETLTALAPPAGGDPRPLLGVRGIFGDLADHPTFATELAAAIADLDHDGVRATLDAYLRIPDQLVP
jgi:fructuronate reductase/mannitol 2-dehydrogenase